MDIILHVGAHRAASTSFQRYLKVNAAALAAQRTRAWGPQRTRAGLLRGVMPLPDGGAPADQLARARGRVALACAASARAGLARVIVSDENMLGAPRTALRQERLYADAGQRMARFASVFDGRPLRVALVIRSLEWWWASVLGYALMRGHRLPDTAMLDRLVTQPRSWRDVVADLAAAWPGTEIAVLPFERVAGRPDLLLGQVTGGAVTPPLSGREGWHNRTPSLDGLRAVLAAQGRDPSALPGGEGRWMPFDTSQRAALLETYADDLFWLRAGADGLARLFDEEPGPTRAGQPPGGPQDRGHSDDRQEGDMVGTG